MKKKSRAAQRLVSLVLALGLIFTLAPASAFAGDEAPASSAVMAAVDEEPVADGTEPVVDDSEPAVDDSAPVVDGTEPVADDSEPVVDDSEPVADGTEPAEEPAVEQDALKPTKVAASAPVVMSGAPTARGMFDETFYVEADPSLEVYAAYTHLTFGGYWMGTNYDGIELNVHVQGNDLFYFVKAPNGVIPEVTFTSDGGPVTGTMEPLTDDIFDGDWIGHKKDFLKKAQDAGCNYLFRFSGFLIDNLFSEGDTVNIKITAKEAPAKTQSAYFYLHRPDVESGSEAVKTDYYYIGVGSVNIPYDLELGCTIEKPSADKITAPQPSNSIIFDNELRDITEYQFDKDETGAPGTYSFVSWDVIKCENGATTAYPDNKVIVENGLTWHVDGTIKLNRPAAYFYGLKPGAEAASTNPDDYYYLGTGEVTLEPATATEIGRTVDLDKTNRDKLVYQEPQMKTFPSIEYNGVLYNFDVAGTKEPNTYSVSDWNNVMAPMARRTSRERPSPQIPPGT